MCDCQQCMEFRKDLAEVINKHSMENGSNAPDFILAEFLHGCLMVFNKLMRRREGWYSLPELQEVSSEEAAPRCAADDDAMDGTHTGG